VVIGTDSIGSYKSNYQDGLSPLKL
jgi:hypothetical protein